ncbi:hypothetical protein KAH94_02945, partial [bacterium]|nr:hypothetical protein [bacterium]
IFLQMLIGMADKIKLYEERLNKAGGTTDEVAKKQLTPFQKGWAKLSATLTEVTGKFFLIAGPVFQDLFTFISVNIKIIATLIGAFVALKTAVLLAAAAQSIFIAVSSPLGLIAVTAGVIGATVVIKKMIKTMKDSKNDIDNFNAGITKIGDTAPSSTQGIDSLTESMKKLNEESEKTPAEFASELQAGAKITQEELTDKEKERLNTIKKITKDLEKQQGLIQEAEARDVVRVLTRKERIALKEEKDNEKQVRKTGAAITPARRKVIESILKEDEKIQERIKQREITREAIREGSIEDEGQVLNLLREELKTTKEMSEIKAQIQEREKAGLKPKQDDLDVIKKQKRLLTEIAEAEKQRAAFLKSLDPAILAEHLATEEAIKQIENLDIEIELLKDAIESVPDLTIDFKITDQLKQGEKGIEAINDELERLTQIQDEAERNFAAIMQQTNRLLADPNITPEQGQNILNQQLIATRRITQVREERAREAEKKEKLAEFKRGEGKIPGAARGLGLKIGLGIANLSDRFGASGIAGQVQAVGGAIAQAAGFTRERETLTGRAGFAEFGNQIQDLLMGNKADIQRNRIIDLLGIGNKGDDRIIQAIEDIQPGLL